MQATAPSTLLWQNQKFLPFSSKNKIEKQNLLVVDFRIMVVENFFA